MSNPLRGHAYLYLLNVPPCWTYCMGKLHRIQGMTMIVVYILYIAFLGSLCLCSLKNYNVISKTNLRPLREVLLEQ